MNIFPVISYNKEKDSFVVTHVYHRAEAAIEHFNENREYLRGFDECGNYRDVLYNHDRVLVREPRMLWSSLLSHGGRLYPEESIYSGMYFGNLYFLIDSHEEDPLKKILFLTTTRKTLSSYRDSSPYGDPERYYVIDYGLHVMNDSLVFSYGEERAS